MINTASPSPQKRILLYTAVAVGMVAFLGSLSVGLYLVTKSQDIRQQASTVYDNSITVGPTRPTDQQLNYTQVTLNADPSVFNITSNDPLVSNAGHAIGFRFQANQGQELHLLAKEVDISTVGSYVESTLYGPDGNRITTAQTRIDPLRISTTGTYYWVIYTFNPTKLGHVRLAIFERNKLETKFSLITQQAPEQSVSINNLDNPTAASAYPFSIAITFPTDAALNQDGTISYFDKLEGISSKVRPVIRKYDSLDTLRSEYQRNSMKQAETIRETQGSGVRILVTPGGNDSFPANSYYLANLEYVYDDYGASGSSAISVWSTKSNNSGLSSADINRDNRVDLRDFSIMNAEFMKNLSQYQADLNHDGRVDIIDFSILNNQFSLL